MIFLIGIECEGVRNERWPYKIKKPLFYVHNLMSHLAFTGTNYRFYVGGSGGMMPFLTSCRSGCKSRDTYYSMGKKLFNLSDLTMLIKIFNLAEFWNCHEIEAISTICFLASISWNKKLKMKMDQSTSETFTRSKFLKEWNWSINQYFLASVEGIVIRPCWFWLMYAWGCIMMTP